MKRADIPTEVFRLGRTPEPWAWLDWAYAESDGTFGNRFDDHRGIYRVLYASTQRLGTFVECLAYFRPDVELIAELAEITDDEGDNTRSPEVGVVPRQWIERRCVGVARLIGDYVDVGHHETLAELRTALAVRVVHYGSPTSMPQARRRFPELDDLRAGVAGRDQHRGVRGQRSGP